ncbi:MULTISPECIES: nuclear transport factor 2 family protein [unclassified Variovorax]|uniref:aromatic-ring-hydroxylating dioxygenase subunit beta n=1 Tax=unclassified Variovorax TaxID=663243 RepID=UPI00076C53D7|nr:MULTISPECIES: nuclear transport factor 2 family protein [unclassified Variovorax]KWT83523.1 Ortho-halobenzoate 1,2-dioxygenase beta-ISP protein OhbA [Variovorax sp. WDL1]PNG59624.1 Terephthalate 1,2-dioxygenase, terminal oxygenase component subunit beta 1 [Variovorax sp. B4]PNG60585.1 Terephthalate 1,2-dioxygenase, terminal oxygenase component subunit beta 1 [Variovorax sp. B2]VTV13524.1 Terephthalate 1,2-dioxygenase, terminal oxygenase component subunit beta 1 [Variovorax sp. WDL1]
MIDLLALCAFNAAYAHTIDSDALEQWPGYFTEDCHYRITHVENEREGLPAGIVYADSRAMLEDRIAALREANIFERQRYRHLLGIPLVQQASADGAMASTPFMVARIMATGQTEVFATGVYQDRFVQQDGRLKLQSRVAVCDSTVTDTLLALPL